MTTRPIPPESPSFWNPGAMVPARTLALSAIGALIGLAIAGYGLFTANGTTTAIYPAEDAAIVNGVPILRIDLANQLTALYSLPDDQITKAQRDRMLHDMIREELYVQRGIELGMPTDDTDVRAALVGATEAQTVSQDLTSLPSPAMLAAYYTTHRARYASEGVMTVSDWVVPAAKVADAAAMADRLRAGAAPTAPGLTRTAAADGTEQFYFAARIHLGNALYAVAETMADATVSPPITVGGRVHILAMAHNVHPVIAAYADVKARVLQDYTDDLKKRVLEDNTKFLFGRARISVAPGLQ